MTLHAHPPVCLLCPLVALVDVQPQPTRTLTLGLSLDMLVQRPKWPCAHRDLPVSPTQGACPMPLRARPCVTCRRAPGTVYTDWIHHICRLRQSLHSRVIIICATGVPFTSDMKYRPLDGSLSTASTPFSITSWSSSMPSVSRAIALRRVPRGLQRVCSGRVRWMRRRQPLTALDSTAAASPAHLLKLTMVAWSPCVARRMVPGAIRMKCVLLQTPPRSWMPEHTDTDRDAPEQLAHACNLTMQRIASK